ncbi:MAG: sulfatase-like hydrolase/transferase [Pseudomonadota bacterium]
MTQRPNFLLIMTDQHRADHLGCYGNPIVATPQIAGWRGAASRSTGSMSPRRFALPNRATLMTGRMPSVHGVRHNGIPLSLRATTFRRADAGRRLSHRDGRQGRICRTCSTSRLLVPDPA